MTLIKPLPFLFLITIYIVGCTKEVSAARRSNSFVIHNVNIVDVEHQQIRRNKSVYVKSGIIEAIFDQSTLSLPDNLKSYSGNSGYLTPGLIDMHVHIYEPAAYLMTLSHGVTHVRIMNGVPQQLEWRDKIASGEMLGSTSTVSSPIISGYKNASLHHGVETALEAKRAVNEYFQQGYDLIKAYGNLNQEALLAIINEARKKNLPVAKHGPHASGEMLLSQLAGFQSFEHVEDIYQGPLKHQFSTEQLPVIVKEIKATQVPITPTLNIFFQLTMLSAEKEAYLEQLPRDYISPIIRLSEEHDQVKRWLSSSQEMVEHNKRTMKFLQGITQIMHQRGVKLLVGSDSGVLLSPHGIATHTEMKLMQGAGITTFDVLAAATLNPAKALRLENEIGKIAPKHRADFIYTKNNPIDDLSILIKPAAVVKGGHWYSEIELKVMRDNAIAKRSLWQEITTLYEAL
ncbi:amidohydrolase family protein [Thalassotalea ganghwensis]